MDANEVVSFPVVDVVGGLVGLVPLVVVVVVGGELVLTDVVGLVAGSVVSGLAEVGVVVVLGLAVVGGVVIGCGGFPPSGFSSSLSSMPSMISEEMGILTTNGSSSSRSLLSASLLVLLCLST